MSIANGEELKSRGVFHVPAPNAEGYDVSQSFEDTDVEFPILVVAGVSQCGSKGSHVNFLQDDGMVVNLCNNGSSNFISRHRARGNDKQGVQPAGCISFNYCPVSPTIP